MKDLNKHTKMNYFKRCFVLVFLIICSYQSKAHPIYGTITNFEVLPEYLNANGKIKINSLTATTEVKYKVTIVRTVYSTYPTLTWNGTNITFGLSSANSASTPIYVSATRQVTNSSFNGNEAVLQDLIVTANISRVALAGNRIILGYETPDDWTIQSYNGASYNYEIYTPQPVIGTPPAFTAPVSGSVPLYEYASDTKRVLTTTYYSSYPELTYNGILGYVFNSPVTGAVPLYQYFRQESGNRFYTVVHDTPWGYTGGDVVCYVYPSQVVKTLPIYQHYKGSSTGGYHFYTNYPGVHENYEFQDVQFYLLQNKQPTINPLPDDDYAEVYCYWNPTINDHYYTTVKKDYWGYTYEFVLGYVSRTQRPGTVPLYSYYKSADDHFYTIQKQDYWSYLYEGIVGYVYTTAQSGTVGIYSYYNDYSVDHYYKTTNTTIPGYNNEGIKFYMMQYNY